MEDTQITYAIAKLANEKGIKDCMINDKLITQSILQKILREEYEIHVHSKVEFIGSDEWEYSYKIKYLPKDKQDVKRRTLEFKTIYSFKEDGTTYIGAWNTYEKALEEGLLKALTLM